MPYKLAPTTEKELGLGDHDWGLFRAQAFLGECLLGLRSYAEAEPLLLSGYEGMHQRASRMPAKQKKWISSAGEQIVDLYSQWSKPEQATQWRNKLQAQRSQLGSLGNRRYLPHRRLIGSYRSTGEKSPFHSSYEVKLTCRASDEAHLRTLLLTTITQSKAALQSIHSEDIEGTNRNRIQAEIITAGLHNEIVEQMVTRLSFEPGVSAISWSVVPASLE